MKIEAELSEMWGSKNWSQHAFHKKINTHENQSCRLNEKEDCVFMKTNSDEEYLSRETLPGNKLKEMKQQEIINEELSQSASF